MLKGAAIFSRPHPCIFFRHSGRFTCSPAPSSLAGSSVSLSLMGSRAFTRSGKPQRSVEEMHKYKICIYVIWQCSWNAKLRLLFFVPLCTLVTFVAEHDQSPSSACSGTSARKLFFCQFLKS